jgi:hypothetical protein
MGEIPDCFNGPMLVTRDRQTGGITTCPKCKVRFIPTWTRCRCEPQPVKAFMGIGIEKAIELPTEPLRRF